jgi:NADH:ubiquinone oxidoreductase subunit E
LSSQAPTVEESATRIAAGFSRDRSALIPLLQALQQEFGYLPPEALSAAAERLKLSESAVYGVASFYTQFRSQPSGRHIIKVCRGTACHVGGGEKILDELRRGLDVEPGGTSADGEYSLETVACVGACALAPVVLVNEEIIGRSSAGSIIAGVKHIADNGNGCSCRR